eukprot:2725643-Amphidinium_carterae.4
MSSHSKGLKRANWQLGRWSHHLLPYAGGLHVYNVYGYSSDDPLALEKSRALCIEVLGSVSSLEPRQVLLGGDWNFEPSDMPIDLVHGGQVVRTLSDEEATAPKREKVKLDWFLTSKILAPACGQEEATDLKPDHVAAEASDLKRQVLVSGPVTCFAGPSFFGPHTLTGAEQLTGLDAWFQSTAKTNAKKRRDGWNQGTTAVWDLAVHDEGGTPQLQKLRSDKASEWSYHTLRSVIKHCPSGKARGADRWGMSEIKLLPDQAVRDLVVFHRSVEVMASWPPGLKEMLYLQVPKEGAKNAAERRPDSFASTSL